MTRPNALQIGLAVLAVVVVLALAWNFDPFGRRERAEQKAADAVAGEDIAEASTRSLDRYTHETVIVREKANDAVKEIRREPQADAPLDPGLRSSLCAGLGRMRDADPACVDRDSPDLP